MPVARLAGNEFAMLVPSESASDAARDLIRAVDLLSRREKPALSNFLAHDVFKARSPEEVVIAPASTRGIPAIAEERAASVVCFSNSKPVQLNTVQLNTRKSTRATQHMHYAIQHIQSATQHSTHSKCNSTHSERNSTHPQCNSTHSSTFNTHTHS